MKIFGKILLEQNKQLSICNEKLRLTFHLCRSVTMEKWVIHLYDWNMLKNLIWSIARSTKEKKTVFYAVVQHVLPAISDPKAGDKFLAAIDRSEHRNVGEIAPWERLRRRCFIDSPPHDGISPSAKYTPARFHLKLDFLLFGTSIRRGGLIYRLCLVKKYLYTTHVVKFELLKVSKKNVLLGIYSVFCFVAKTHRVKF